MDTLILFDLDGTLLDSLEDLADATNYVLAQYGCPPRTLEQIRSFVGNGARRLIASALPGRADDPPVDRVLESYKTHYSLHALDKTRPYAGILEALEQIASRHRIGIVSNKPDVATKALSQALFGGIPAWGESDRCRRKPAPDMLYHAMQELGAAQCIYVGDSEVDVATAKNAGCKCISVLWGFRDKACLEQAGAEHFCTDPAQLPLMIEELIHGQ